MSLITLFLIILFSILTTNAFPATLLLVPGNTVFFVLKVFCRNVPEGIIDRNVSIVFVLFS